MAFVLIIQQLIPYIGLEILGTLIIRWLAKFSDGLPFAPIIYLLCIIMWLFMTSLIVGHIYYLSGIFQPY